MSDKKTLNDLIGSKKDVFVPNDVCGVLRCDPYTISLTAKQRPELLGFKTSVIGNRVKIPRISFLLHMGVPMEVIEKRGQVR